MAFSGPRQKARSFGRRAQFIAAAPVILIVAVAVACTIFVLFWSAQRADVVALEHERRLFSTSIEDRQTQLLSEIEYIASSSEALQKLWLQLDEAWIHQQVGLRLKHQYEYTMVLLVDADSEFVHPLSGKPDVWLDLAGGSTLRELGPVLAGVAVANWHEEALRPHGATRIQEFLGYPAIVAAAPIAMPARSYGDTGSVRVGAAPTLVVVNFMVAPFLQQVGARLRLPNLRIADATNRSGDENALTLAGDNGAPIARFVWEPNRPGGQIVRKMLPFIAIALGCFILLASFAVRYTRRTTATIAEGESRLHHLAMHDPLSGLPNRMMFGEHLETALDAVKRGGSPVALLSIDLDHFKDVNDTLGHHIGDELITAVADRLCRIVREDDLVARLGGDEFAVLTPRATSRGALEEMAKRIITSLSTPYIIGPHTLVIGASVGMVMIDKNAHDAADIMRFADMALYRAKNEGRNRACLYDAAMSADLTLRKRMEHELRNAIYNDGLLLEYQPLVSPDGQRMIGVEALCRWPHPRRGLVPPSDFIPVAEQSNLIIPLGEWALRRACRDASPWKNVTLAVNVSPVQFRRPDFVDVVERILKETKFEPERLELELTESTLLGNLEGAALAMQRLKALGVKLALDDFGTGYSSLLYLRRLPFDKLKIDRSFIKNLETAAEAAAIVHAIVGLGRGLGMKVTAEGVENAEQQLFLRAAGVHSMQGFRFGRPVGVQVIAERVEAEAAPDAHPARLAIAN